MSFGNPQVLNAAGSSVTPSPAPTPKPYAPATTSTPPSGTPLINGTGNLLTATAPNDGQPHQAIIAINTYVSVLEVGGQLDVNATLNGQANNIPNVIGAGGTVGVHNGNNASGVTIMIDPGTTVSITQQSALTSGAAVLYGKITIL